MINPDLSTMAYSDLHFNNIQLMKLVSSAEILFQHLYDLMSTENKMFIDQWFIYKQEFDEACAENSQFDVNENVQECPILARIDEVSENERVSSMSSASTESTPSVKADELNDNCSVSSKEDVSGSHENDEATRNGFADLSQLDSDLLDYMTDFKLLTDGKVSDWLKNVSINRADVKPYIRWLENKEYENILADQFTGNCQKYDSNHIISGGFQNVQTQIDDDQRRRFVPIETCPRFNSPMADVLNVPTRNLTSGFNVHQDDVIDQHIRYLQEIRKTLLCAKQDANKKLKNKDEVPSSAECHNFIKVDVAFEVIDLAIEMKNQLKLGHDIQNLTMFDEKVDAVINNCLRLLTLKEIRHLLFTYLNNVTVMRKCSSEHDKQVSELDREISNQKFLIWRLYMIINENKRSYQSRCLTLHKEFEQKLQLAGRVTTDESNDESVAGASGRALLPILEKNSLQDSTQSDSRDTQNGMACVPHIPEKNLKTLQSTPSASSSNMKVKRDRTKLIIKPQKH